jgi:hypothetical protein
VKTLLKLVIVALLANALWRVGSAYATFYKFTDAINGAATEPGRTDEQLKDRIVELAGNYDVPLDADAVTIVRAENHTRVDAAYKKRVAVLPGYEYAWPFTISVDAYVIVPPTRRKDLVSP